jgi:ABC-type glycerol-3-phosphate transport system substrate-binding protein
MAAEAMARGARRLAVKTRRSCCTRAIHAFGGLAAMGLTGCAGSDQANNAPAQVPPASVTYMSNLPETHPEGMARLALLQEFNATNAQQITVVLDEARGATTLDKLKTLAAGGTPPDLAYVDYFTTVNLHVSAATIDVETELKKERDWARQRADIFPAMLDSCLWLGKLVGLPGYTNNSGIIYNKGLLERFGIPAPKSGWTWTEFREVALRVQRPPVRWAFSFPWGRWLRFLGTTGTQHVSKDLRRMTVDSPEAVETLEFLVGLVKAGVIPPDGSNELYRQATNDIVFESQGPFRIPTLRQVGAPDFGVVHTPVHPQKRRVFTEVGGHNMVVFREVAPQRRHAGALTAQWMNKPHAQAQMCIRATQIPVNKSVLNAPELEAYLKTDEQLKSFVELAPTNWGWPGLPSAVELLTLTRTTDPVFKEQMSVRAWLAETQRQAQEVLNKDLGLMK